MSNIRVQQQSTIVERRVSGLTYVNRRSSSTVGKASLVYTTVTTGTEEPVTEMTEFRFVNDNEISCIHGRALGLSKETVLELAKALTAAAKTM